MKARRWCSDAVAAALVAAALGTGAAASAAVPSFDAVRAAHAPSDRTLLDRHGEPLHTLRVDASVRRGPWVALADVSPALRHALLLSEDRRFWQHGGVDWRALAAGAWANAWNQRTRGASTVTMQLAALLDDELKRPAGGRDLGDKLAQMRRARALEARWSKAQILEAYLNAVPLRGELVGLSAAADQLFAKHPSGLDALEAALLAAMVRAPNAPAAAVERRACELLREQAHEGVDPCAGLATTLAQALARPPGALRVAGADRGEMLAPHFARQWFATPRTAEARSTLDARVQRLALAALRRQLAELRGREVDDGAVVVLDNASGAVLAWVGSAGRGSAAAAVDAVLARRQPGSTIKPFVYALALEERLVTAASRLDDTPLALSTGGATGGGQGLYAPRNYDHAYRGAVSARTALASSLNVPAVRVGALVGADALFARLQQAGLRLTESAGFHGHALALGSADVTLLDLTNAYRALARDGRVSAPQAMVGDATPGERSVLDPVTAEHRVLDPVTAERRVFDPVTAERRVFDPVTAEHRVFDPAVAWLVADILADPAARAVGFGLDSPLVTRGWAAVKTGTSKDMRDNWCIGFTDRYTVGVWIGNASGAPMHGVSGVEGAAPVWREIVAALHQGRPSRAPAPPPGLRRAAGEWWLDGTGPGPTGLATGAATGPAAAAAAFGILRPRDGSVIALDPEIPPAAQRLVIEGAAGRWVLNGRPLFHGARLEWLPRPGRHVLERHAPGHRGDAEGGRIERVRFEVRPGQAAALSTAPPAAPPAAPIRRPRG